MASEASAYTSDELNAAKAMMDRQETTMRDYKIRYYNEMPGQRESNVSRLIALQEQYQNEQENILDLERTKVLIQEQIASRIKVLNAEYEEAQLVQALPAGQEIAPQGSKLDQLLRMRSALDGLKAKYTDNHPDIKRLNKLIAQLESELPANVLSASKRPGDARKIVRRNLIEADENILNLQTQINDIDRKIKSIEKEKEKLSEEIEEYEAWVSAAPIRESEWTAITREYGELKRHYDYLVAQNLQAKSMLNLERRQEGSQLRIEDPARLPQKPIKPEFIKVMILTIGGAMAMAGGFLLMVSFLDGSFRDPEDLESYLGLPVVSVVSYFETNREKRFRILRSAAVVVVVLGLIAFSVGAFWWAWTNGKIIV